MRKYWSSKWRSCRGWGSRCAGRGALCMNGNSPFPQEEAMIEYRRQAKGRRSPQALPVLRCFSGSKCFVFCASGEKVIKKKKNLPLDALTWYLSIFKTYYVLNNLLRRSLMKQSFNKKKYNMFSQPFCSLLEYHWANQWHSIRLTQG